jgi:hypothetical protein
MEGLGVSLSSHTFGNNDRDTVVFIASVCSIGSQGSVA